jgi:hypothetical protein
MSITIRRRYGGICSVDTLRNNLGPVLQDLAGGSDRARTQYEQGPCRTSPRPWSRWTHSRPSTQDSADDMGGGPQEGQCAPCSARTLLPPANARPADNCRSAATSPLAGSVDTGARNLSYTAILDR